MQNLAILFFADTLDIVLHTESELDCQMAGLKKLQELRMSNSKRVEYLYLLNQHNPTDYLVNNVLTNKEELKARWVYSLYDDKLSGIYSLKLADMNPYNLDYTQIPEGSYCYSGVESTSTDAATGMPIRKMKMCPFYSEMLFNGVGVPWCQYLGKGGTEGSLKQDQTESEAEEEYQKLLTYFGTKANMEKVLPLMLLFDSCKECGINKVI